LVYSNNNRRKVTNLHSLHNPVHASIVASFTGTYINVFTLFTFLRWLSIMAKIRSIWPPFGFKYKCLNFRFWKF
jgi:hypothetical protein